MVAGIRPDDPHSRLPMGLGAGLCLPSMRGVSGVLRTILGAGAIGHAQLGMHGAGTGGQQSPPALCCPTACGAEAARTLEGGAQSL